MYLHSATVVSRELFSFFRMFGLSANFALVFYRTSMFLMSGFERSGRFADVDLVTNLTCVFINHIPIRAGIKSFTSRIRPYLFADRANAIIVRGRMSKI